MALTGFPVSRALAVIDNDQTWLDVSDLVFIDPVGTGFSRPAEGIKGSDFYGVKQDCWIPWAISSVFSSTGISDGIAPSFWPAKATAPPVPAGLSAQLLDRYGIDLNGIILISTVLNFQTLDTSGSNDLAFALYLPSYTAIALYHHKLQTADEDKLLNEVRDYATNDYLTAARRKAGALSKDARALDVHRTRSGPLYGAAAGSD